MAIKAPGKIPKKKDKLSELVVHLRKQNKSLKKLLTHLEIEAEKSRSKEHQADNK